MLLVFRMSDNCDREDEVFQASLRGETGFGVFFISPKSRGSSLATTNKTVALMWL